MAIDWIDPETQAILRGNHPSTDDAIATQGFSLLLVLRGHDHTRAQEAIDNIQHLGGFNETLLPNVVAQNLSLRQALAGQFALSCCDCISALLRDEIVVAGNLSYLDEVSREVAASREYGLVDIQLEFVPDSGLGREFCWQFFGYAKGLAFPVKASVFRKKARLMKHWAAKCGAILNCNPI